MIKVKFPFDVKYYDSIENEAVVINLTLQGADISERQCVDIAFMLLAKKDLKSIIVYNPEKENTYYLMKFLNQKRDKFNSSIIIEEVTEYEV